MIDQHHIDFVLNHQMFVPGVAIAGLLVLFLVIKFLTGSRSSKVARSLEDAPKLTVSGKKKRGKKQRNAQDKKGSDSPKLKKDSKKNEIDSLIETSKRTVEDGKNDKKKDGKSRAKSKKKKSTSNQIKAETIPEPQMFDAIDSGEWKTVSTKEQREQLKREKRKLEENTALSSDSAIDKPLLEPLVQPFIKPTTNFSAIAKGIAPRFARAAGEQWQEKAPTIPAVSMPLQSKRPMPPAAVPGVKLQTSRTTTVIQQQQSWVSGSQGKQFWPADIGTTWPNSTVATSTTNLSPDLGGMSWPNTNTTTLLSMTTSTEKVSAPGWPQGGSTWQPSGSPTTNTAWDSNMEDWVHINGQNGRNANATTENWVGGDSPVRTQDASKKIEEWTLEPEGFPLEPPQLDPNDPWNLEVVGNNDGGDWSAPASTWDNTNSGWMAPQPVKPPPTYIDESSDDEKIVSKVPSNPPNASSPLTNPQSVVGAGPDFMSQANTQNKKSRRRRKKKNATNEPEQLSSPETDSPKTIETLTKPDPEQSTPETKETEEVKDDWTVPKASKKRKNKARKAD